MRGSRLFAGSICLREENRRTRVTWLKRGERGRCPKLDAPKPRTTHYQDHPLWDRFQLQCPVGHPHRSCCHRAPSMKHLATNFEPTPRNFIWTRTAGHPASKHLTSASAEIWVWELLNTAGSQSAGHSTVAQFVGRCSVLEPKVAVYHVWL